MWIVELRWVRVEEQIGERSEMELFRCGVALYFPFARLGLEQS